MLKKLLELIKSKDSITYIHSVNVLRYVNAYCKFYDVSISETNNLVYGAMVHDIGKIFIPDSILNKKTSLTKNEFEIMRKHSYLGYRFLKNEGVSKDIYIYSLYHHNRIDGNNSKYDFSENIDYEDKNNIEKYQKGINLISICDSFDAMTAKRTYNQPKAFEAAFKEINECKNSQFDAETATKFLDQYSNSKLEYA